MKIVIRVDSHPGMGSGHVMRCLTLANALSGEGAVATFLCSSIDPGLVRLVEAEGHEVRSIVSPLPGDRFDYGWERSAADDAAQAQDLAACRTAIGENAPDLVIVDHYLLDARWEAGWTDSRVLVIDDLANRPHQCAMLVDQNLGRTPADHAAQVPSGCVVLAGPDYALLRPEFAQLRAQALARRRTTERIETILVNFGAMDAGGLTLPVLQGLAQAGVTAKVLAICGSTAPGTDEIARFAEQSTNIELLLDRRDMAQQMVAADLAIGASGATSWERCALGLPSILIEAAENQRFLNQQLEQAGAIIRSENVEQIIRETEAMMADLPRWHELVACSAAIADGKGVDRVIGELLRSEVEVELQLREANLGDALTLWAWRNEPLARQMARNTRSVPLEDHYRWLEASLASSSRTLLIGSADGELAGTIRFDYAGEEAEISINVARPMRRRKLGKALLRAGREYATTRTGCRRIRALVRPQNEASRRLFESCDYERGEMDGECIVYRLELPPADIGH